MKFWQKPKRLYSCTKGAENTKVSTNNKCKVWNVDNNLQDSVNQEYKWKSYQKFKYFNPKTFKYTTSTRETHKISIFSCHKLQNTQSSQQQQTTKEKGKVSKLHNNRQPIVTAINTVTYLTSDTSQRQYQTPRCNKNNTARNTTNTSREQYTQNKDYMENAKGTR